MKTAANDKFLKVIKKIFNSKIYKKARLIYISDGLESAEMFISQFCNYKRIAELIN